MVEFKFILRRVGSTETNMEDSRHTERSDRKTRAEATAGGSLSVRG